MTATASLRETRPSVLPSVAAIRTVGLTKRYGAHVGVDGVDLTVEQGEVFGYLGPNGAGKTTTIRVLLDLIRATSGSASIFGLDSRIDSREVRRRVGYLPGELALYEQMTGLELFDFFARIRGHVSRPVIDELAARLELDPSRRIRELSKGNKQKVGLIQALMHRPPLLVLDEPTSGLDPLVQQQVHDILREAAAEGRTVFLSSHTLSEVEQVAHRIGIIRAGSIAVVEDVATLKSKALRRMEIHFRHPVAAREFAALPGVQVDRNDQSIVSLRVAGSVDKVLKAAARHEVVNLVSHEPDLEEIFLEYFRPEV